MELPLKGYRLATAEIVYHMPDHPGVLQAFIWQHYDLAPHYPVLKRFLAFWEATLDGALHSVRSPAPSFWPRTRSGPWTAYSGST